MNPREQLAAAIKAARDLAVKVKSENRNFTAEEQTEIDGKMAEIDRLKQKVAAGEKSATLLGQLDAMAAGETTFDADGTVVDSLGLLKDGMRLSFGSKMAGAAIAKMQSPQGVKALASTGSVVVGQEFTQSPIELGKPANNLLAVLPVKQHATPKWTYLRQSVRTNNAAVVADGATKPTSIYTVAPVDGALAIIAHMSEAVPRYWFIDNSNLQPFLANELGWGLTQAVEAKVLADVNGTSGIQTQAFTSTVLQTLRKTVTKLEMVGHVADFFLMHPTDWETLELALSTTNAIEHMSLPYDPAARRLFGVPVVVSFAQAAGVSHTVANGAVSVDTDTTGVGVQWSETSNADDFAKNLIRARCEGRFGTSVYTPLGVVKAALAA